MASSPPPLDSIVGAFLIATCADLFLLGIIVIQAYTFYTKTDRKINPYTWSLVTFLVVLDFVSSALSIAEIYEFAVTGFGDYENLSQLPVAYGVQLPIGGLSAIAVQLFFAHRIWKLTPRWKFRWMIPSIVSTGSAIGLAFTILICYDAFSVDRRYLDFGQFETQITVIFILAPLVDLLIAASMFYCLKMMKTENKVTLNIIDRIISDTFETNGLTFLMSIILLILFKLPSTGLWFTVPGITFSKFDSNSLLVSVNSRDRGQDPVPTTTVTNGGLEDGLGTRKLFPSPSRARSHNHSVVKVTMHQDDEMELEEKDDHIFDNFAPIARDRSNDVLLRVAPPSI